jgi:hypothetical protein
VSSGATAQIALIPRNIAPLASPSWNGTLRSAWWASNGHGEWWLSDSSPVYALVARGLGTSTTFGIGSHGGGAGC